MGPPFRFEEFSFDHELGELTFQDESGREQVTRLAPQPSRLLLLLLENYPNIVSHRKIKDAIWPEVQVDFERSLHFCIRQIRSALNDSASSPRFIQTVPRRGYRWMVSFEKSIPSQSPAPRFRLSAGKMIGLGLILMIAVLFFSLIARDTRTSAPLRIAVMPFQPGDKNSDFSGNDIALQLVELLTNGNKDGHEVIGPSTTEDYQRAGIPTLIREYGINYVINGRFSMAGDTSRLLAEIIRADDGAHVWVRYFNSTMDNPAIVGAIIAGFQEQFNQNTED